MIKGRIDVNDQNLLILEAGKKVYTVRSSRQLPVIPGDVVSARLQAHRHSTVAVPFQLHRSGKCRIYGQVTDVWQDRSDQIMIDFSYWQLPSMSPPSGFLPDSSSRIVEVDIARNSDDDLYISSLRQKVCDKPQEEIYQWTILRFGLREAFPDGVINQTNRLKPEAIAASIDQRIADKDMRSIPFVTIDGDDARDFDDAVCCRRHTDGYDLFVAIADVAHFVASDTPLDQEAFSRCSSVYFPGKVLPMLPARLSDDVCSLLPQRLRLAMICHIKLDRQGHCTSHSFIESVIRSRARLSYRQVNTWRKGGTDKAIKQLDSEVLDSLRSMHKLYKLLHRQASDRLDIDMPIFNLKLDTNNNPSQLKREHRGDAEKMIEEFMIQANVACAKTLHANHKSCGGLFRVHPRPRAESIEEIYEQFSSHFTEAKLTRKPEIFKQCLNYLKNREADFWHLYLIRHLELAEYTPTLSAHFGLALSHYAHFTSPIRRYSDLVNHRHIKNIIHNQSLVYTCSDLERLAAQVNNQVRCNDRAMLYQDKLMRLTLSQSYIGNTMSAVVDSATPFGVFVYLPDLGLGAFMHQSSIKSYYFDFSSRSFVHRQGQSFERIDNGSKIKVKLSSVDLDRQHIDVAYLRKH